MSFYDSEKDRIVLRNGNGQDVSSSTPLPVIVVSQISSASPLPSIPKGPVNSSISVANTAVVVFTAGTIVNVADIINPPSATEILYIDFVTTAVAGSATSIPLQPGESYRISSPVASVVTAVAATAGHSFIAVRY